MLNNIPNMPSSGGNGKASGSGGANSKAQGSNRVPGGKPGSSPAPPPPGKTASPPPSDEDHRTLSLLSSLRTNLVESCMFSVTNILESIIIGECVSVCVLIY